jgi:hypothetical protein
MTWVNAPSGLYLSKQFLNRVAKLLKPIPADGLSKYSSSRCSVQIGNPFLNLGTNQSPMLRVQLPGAIKQ